MKVLIIIAPFACFLAGSIAGPVPDRCGNCHTVIGTVEENFHNASRQHAYQNFLQVCGQIGNLASACNKINATFFDEIYQYLDRNLHANDFCFKTGECSSSVVPIIQIVRSLPNGDVDSPECELCKELVKHVVSDLTEDNFHELLLDGCKQMNAFQSDCKSITDENYPLLHDYLLDKLNFKAVCSFVGICPGPGLFGPLTAPVVQRVPIPVSKPVPIPVPKPVPVPVPVTPRVSTAGSGSSIYYGPSPGFDTFFNNIDRSLNSLTPALPGLAAIPLLGGLSGAALPLFALG